MAAKKKSTRKTSKKASMKSETVLLALDSDQILVLKAAAEAFSELASAATMGSDDPIVRGTAKKKAAKKSAKKRS